MVRVAKAMAAAMKRAMVTKRVMVRVARAMATVTKRAIGRVARAMVTMTKRATATKRAMERVARAMAMATWVAGNKEGNGKGGKREGNGNKEIDVKCDKMGDDNVNEGGGQQRGQ